VRDVPHPEPPARPYDLGVLFVHGIGEQRQGSTLARFGGSVERWLRRRIPPPEPEHHIAPDPAVEVESVVRHTGDGDAPAHASLLVGKPGEESRQRWLLAEAWWAAEVSPPTFKAFVRWVLPMLPWLAAEYVVAATRRPGPLGAGTASKGPERPRRWFEEEIESMSLAGAAWLLSPVIAVLAMLACGVLALLQRVPVIGRRVNAVTANLVTGVGDAYLFAYDGLARAAMLQRIRHNLDWLRDERRCQKVAVVAHSQGAALCHDLLRSGDLRPEAQVDLLVTVGSGVRRLDGFRRLYHDAKLRSDGWGNIAGLLALVTGMALVLGGLGTAGDAALWAGAGGLAIVAGCSMVDPAPTKLQLPGIVLAVLGTATLVGAGLWSDGWARAALVGGGASMSLGAWLYWRAASTVRGHVEAISQLALPQTAVGRWLDFYSSADPVPNGPTRTREDGQPDAPWAVHPDSQCVYNLRSIHADHSYYFDNADQFVSALVSELAEETKLTQARVGGDDLERARARRRWRTACLSVARNLLLVTGLLSVLAVTLRLGGGPGWAGLGADAGVADGPPYGGLGRLAQWAQDRLGSVPLLGGPAERVAVPSLAGMLLAAAVVAAAALALGRLWSIWDAKETDRFFLPRQAKALSGWRARWPSAAFLAFTGSLALGSMAVVASYAGRSWLVLVVLAGALLLAATRLWREARSCLGPYSSAMV
jgi:hypothetical protein